MDVNRVLKCIGMDTKRFQEQKERLVFHPLLLNTHNFINDTIQNYYKLNVNLFIELLHKFIQS